MYNEHFGLSVEPFSIAPDPKFLFLSDSHNEALAHLLYGFSHGGFVLITGEVGTGKTTLLRNLLDRTPNDVDVAFILNPRLTVKELLETLVDELGVATGPQRPDSVKQYIDVLNKHLLATHQADRSTVLVIDEAQNLTPAVLEQIRLLTNLETNEKKLLRIILLGQPELDEMLAKTELRQLSQRITARYHLASLSKSDTADYVRHRLTRSGGSGDIFTPRALAVLYRLTRGTPRLINVIADRALLGAYVEGKYRVGAGLIKNAAREVLGRKYQQRRQYLFGATTIVAVALLAMGWAWFSDTGTPTQPAAAQEEVALSETTRPAPPQASTRPATAQSDAQPNTATTQSNTSRPLAPAPRGPLTRPDMQPFALQRLAFADVFAKWGARYDTSSSTIPCDFAPRAGLQCLRRNGGWSELKQLNLPVVLELWDDQTGDPDATPFYGALLQGANDQYELKLGNESIQISPNYLRDAWFGTYVLLWQTPPGYQGSVRRGEEHQSVTWVKESLARLYPQSPPASPGNVFDESLHQLVLEFQRREGLLADGVVGPLTLIRINDRLNLPAPRLSSGN